MTNTRRPMGRLSTPDMELKAYDQPGSPLHESHILEVVRGFNMRYYNLMLACSESNEFRLRFEADPGKYLASPPTETYSYLPDGGDPKKDMKTANCVGYVVPDYTIYRLDPTKPYNIIFFKKKGTGELYGPESTKPFPSVDDDDNVFIINEARPLAQQAQVFRNNLPGNMKASASLDKEGPQTPQGQVHYHVSTSGNSYAINTQIEGARYNTGYQLETKLNHVSIDGHDLDIVLAVPYQLMTMDLFDTISGKNDDDPEIILSCS